MGNEDVKWSDSWLWFKKGDLKIPTEALIYSAQEQSLRTNYTTFYTDRRGAAPTCWLCNKTGESIVHIVSECSKVAQREYRCRHDSVARYAH